MKRAALLVVLSLLWAATGLAQGQVVTTGAPNPKTFNGAPTGTCGPQDTAVDTTTGNFYTCKSGAWNLTGSGGGGSNPGGSGSELQYRAGPSTFGAVTGSSVSGSSFSLTGSGRIGGGDPWIDVTAPPYNADPTGATDAGPAMRSACAALGSSAGTMYIPPGLYAIKSTVGNVSVCHVGPSVDHVRIVADPKAIIQAQTGYSGFYMVYFDGGVTDSGVQGGVWDGNGIATSIFGQRESSTRILIDQVEGKNCTGPFVQGDASIAILSPVPEWTFTRNYFHDNGPQAIVINSPMRLTITGNRFTNVGTNSTTAGVACGTCSYYEVTGNKFVNCGNHEGCVYDFGPDKVNISGNIFVSCPWPIHNDTGGGGTMSDNITISSTDSTRGEYFAETSAYTSMNNNVSFNSGNVVAFQHGPGGNISQSQLRVQYQSFDNTTNMVAGSNVALSTDSSDKQEGTGSLVTTTNSSFTTGILFYFPFSSAQFPVWGFADMWIKPVTAAIAKSDLQLVFSQSATCSTNDQVVNVPAVGQNQWFYMSQYMPGWLVSRGSVGWQSFCIKFATSHPSFVVKFDDLKNAMELVGNEMSHNRAINPFGTTMDWDAWQGGKVTNNYVERSDTAGIAYESDASTGVEFVNNESRWQNSTPANTGTHLNVVATAGPSSTIVSNDKTNAGTKYATSGGGTVLFNATGTPTCSSTGTGTSPSCAVQAGSSDSAGTIIVTTGTGSPAATGTITLTFSSTFGVNPPACTFILSQAGAGQWSFRGSVLDTTPTTASDVQTFGNNGFVLSTSTAYRVNYQCLPK